MTAQPRLPSRVNDYRTVCGTVSEHTRVHGQDILWERNDLRSDELLDDVHLEVLDSGRRFKPPVKLRTMLQENPSQYQLSKWGLDETREIVFFPAVIALVEAGLAEFTESDDVTTRPTFDIAIGDRITWDDRRFLVMEIAREKQWGNTNLPIYLRVTCSLWRETTPPACSLPIGSVGPPAPAGAFGGEGTALPEEMR